MSSKSGDRARADKRSKKHRVRRAQVRLLRKISTPTATKSRVEDPAGPVLAEKEAEVA